MAITIKKKTSTVNTTAAKNRTIKYIVIHYTAGTKSTSGQAANTAAYFMGGSASASADFIVDNANIVQYNPDVENRYCWHCGGSKVSSKGGSLYKTVTNKNSIGVEICSTNSTGTVKSANDSTWSFTASALKKATALVQYLMETYSIDSDHVVRHYDVNGKLCPGIVGWNADSGSESKWKSWKSGLTTTASSTTNSTTSTSTSTSSTAAQSYSESLAGTYKVTAKSGLKLRKSPSTGSMLVVMPYGAKPVNYGYYTSVSGVKWLYLQYTKSGKTYTGFASSAYLSKA